MTGHQVERLKIEAWLPPQAPFRALVPLPVVVGMLGIDEPIPTLISRTQAHNKDGQLELTTWLCRT